MKRTPEPELMEGEAQALAYAKADFSAVNQGFVDRFCAMFPDFVEGRILDLGCGPADIPIRLCRTLPRVEVTAVDGSEAMLALARDAIAKAGLTTRIQLQHMMIPRAVGDGGYRAVISNSLLHHLPDPDAL